MYFLKGSIGIKFWPSLESGAADQMLLLKGNRSHFFNIQLGVSHVRGAFVLKLRTINFDSLIYIGQAMLQCTYRQPSNSFVAPIGGLSARGKTSMNGSTRTAESSSLPLL